VSVPLMDRFRSAGILFDGGMGSMLIAQGLEAGWPPEEWNISCPDVVREVHREYLNAGSDVIGTNTFGGTPARLGNHGRGGDSRDLNAAGLRIAHEAIADQEAGRARHVAFSMGPCGEMMPPVGSADETRVRDEFLAQLQGILNGESPDLILVETMIDVREALIAMEAARSVCDVPVAVSMTYSRNQRGFFTMMGNEANVTTRQLEDAGADVVAANCSIASHDMIDLARLLRSATGLPILCQANAGQPGLHDGRPAYDQAPDEFAAHAMQLYDIGINAVGGCCGTTPQFIRLIRERLDGH